MQDGSYRVSLRVGAPTLNDTFVFPKILNAKFNFIYIAINQILTDFFSNFFAIFLFSAQKNCTFALRKRGELLDGKLGFSMTLENERWNGKNDHFSTA